MNPCAARPAAGIRDSEREARPAQKVTDGESGLAAADDDDVYVHDRITLTRSSRGISARSILEPDSRRWFARKWAECGLADSSSEKRPNPMVFGHPTWPGPRFNRIGALRGSA